MTKSGYTPCKCRDCMEIAISNDTSKPDYCNACEGKCGPEHDTSGECQAEHAYCEAAGEADFEDAHGLAFCGACGQPW
jgi:hypothetical protein